MISAATATTLSNVLLGRVSVLSDRIVAGALVLDVGLLTGVVALTGGASNPFAVLLIVHIALASVVSRSAWSWAVVIAAVIAYASLFFVSVDAHLWHTAVDLEIVRSPIQLHLVGMWAATAIAAIAIASPCWPESSSSKRNARAGNLSARTPGRSATRSIVAARSSKE